MRKEVGRPDEDCAAESLAHEADNRRVAPVNAGKPEQEVHLVLRAQLAMASPGVLESFSLAVVRFRQGRAIDHDPIVPQGCGES